jgi:hypothetical protein
MGREELRTDAGHATIVSHQTGVGIFARVAPWGGPAARRGGLRTRR